MKFIGDFHIHSHYSGATSMDLVPESLDYWAKLKGIRVVGTGDFTHPGWLNELKEKLEDAEHGLFRLKPVYKKKYIRPDIPQTDDDTRFVLTSEISTIYKKKGKVRKVHHLIFAPDFATVEKIQRALSKIGNITSDGRPILGLDSRNLLEIALNASEAVFFAPSHIWTPWFSVLGSKSGFDSVEDCYEDLTPYIHAVETGLSSDPPMNWMCSFLDRFTLISNSDAHSPEKLGREANLFDTELSYEGIIQAIKSRDSKRFLGTVEFFPQEGKYHHDGHRKCGISWNPLETLKNNGICPVCGKEVTIGVMNRVAELADRDNIPETKNRPAFYSVIPLKEILSEIVGTGPNSKKVSDFYSSIIQKAGSEFSLLLDTPVETLKKDVNKKLAEAIQRMRNREIFITEGFDGEYGQIKVFPKNEEAFFDDESLFNDSTQKLCPDKKREKRKWFDFDLEEYRLLKNSRNTPSIAEKHEENLFLPPENRINFQELDPEQRRAAEHFRGPALIIAGPGTGKTRVITYRIVNLILQRSTEPATILAVTFTNKAACEMRERLRMLINDEAIVGKMRISTFHSLGHSILREHCEKIGRNKQFSIIDEEDKQQLLNKNLGCAGNQTAVISEAISKTKQNIVLSTEIDDKNPATVFGKYELLLRELNLFDLDDLICHPAKLLDDYPDIAAFYRQRYQWITIDEYQDINAAQYHLIKKILPEHNANICAIGDPNQAIYGFRGADVSFIKKFVNDFPGTALYQLKKSYRCSDFILRASGNVLENKSPEQGFLQGVQEGVKIKIAEHPSDKSEAEFVARTIENMMGGLRFFSMYSDITDGNKQADINSLSDFAVLCRMRAQFKALEKAFNDHNIPCQTISDIPFFHREPVRTIIDLLKISVNPLNKFLIQKLQDKKITGLRELPAITGKKASVRNTILSIIETCLNKNVISSDETSVKELLDFADNFGEDMEEFLSTTTLGTGADTYKPNVEKVSLMTLHAVKGLEFACVFIPGCEDRLLPYSLFENQQSDHEEEKRLLYVGMTRAKQFLFLSHAKKRFILGREYHLERSRFLDNIEKELLEISKSSYTRKEKEDDRQLTLF